MAAATVIAAPFMKSRRVIPLVIFYPAKTSPTSDDRGIIFSNL